MDDLDLGGKPLCVTKACCGTPLPPGMDHMPAASSVSSMKSAPTLAKNVSAVSMCFLLLFFNIFYFIFLLIVFFWHSRRVCEEKYRRFAQQGR